MKDVEFHALALKDLRGFPANVRQAIGQAIRMLQQGEHLPMPISRPFKNVGPGVAELRCRDASGAYRVIYIARIRNKVFVFHAFKKKTQKTPQKEIDTARKRFKEVLDG